ncbi:MAG TPA: hypothetical protein VEX35_02050 [Allosphingosinicella sp.]|nr:hypothetical protein [Allosphingosinicella sp.]
MSAKAYDLRRAREERRKAAQAEDEAERRGRLLIAEIFEARAQTQRTLH